MNTAMMRNRTVSFDSSIVRWLFMMIFLSLLFWIEEADGQVPSFSPTIGLTISAVPTGFTPCYLCNNDPAATITNAVGAVDLSAFGGDPGDDTMVTCQELVTLLEGVNDINGQCSIIYSDVTIQKTCGCTNLVAPTSFSVAPVVASLPIIPGPPAIPSVPTVLVPAVVPSIPTTTAPATTSAAPVAAPIPVSVLALFCLFIYHLIHEV
jgi:hypothetical protein